MKRFIFCSDLHGDMQDPAAVAALFRFVKEFKPQIKIFGGDLWDFRAIRKGASEDERHESMAKDYEAGVEFLKQLQPHYFLRGNHDERLFELAAHGKGIVGDYAQKGVLEIQKITKQMGARMLPYNTRDGILRIGKLKMLHGFHSGINAARQTALVYGASIFGHVHTIDEHSIPGLDRRVARSAGCLCKLEMEYNSRTPSALRHSHGFCYGVINEKTGAYNVWQAEEINGKWILPTGFKER